MMAPSCTRRSSIHIASAFAWIILQATSCSAGLQIPSALRQLFSYQPPTSTPTSNNNDDDVANVNKKRIVFIRHGCTFMNEYLSKSGCHFGEPHFSDVFSPKEEEEKYRDTPLSHRGIRDAKALSRRLEESYQNQVLLDQLELVVVSPLTRALQTLEQGLLPSLQEQQQQQPQTTPQSRRHGSQIPIVALPYAAERVYLISDIGTPRSKLKSKFPFVDFDSGFDKNTFLNPMNSGNDMDDPWWFTKERYERSSSSLFGKRIYEEWRPHTEGQRYACPGESEDVFEERMMQLYGWLEARPELTIAVVTHWGVIRWMLNVDFRNCEMRVVDFDQIRPRALLPVASTTNTPETSVTTKIK